MKNRAASRPDMCAIPVAWVNLRDRARKDVGNVLGLAESIQRVGLLHPIVVNTRYELIAGGRRLAAVKKLGWTTVKCHVVANLDDALAVLQAERDENTCREPLALADMVALGKRIEAVEKPNAKARQKAGGGKPGSGKLPQPEKPTRDKVASALGVSGRTYEKAKAVVEAAEKEPEKFGDLPAKMEQTGKVDRAYKEMKGRKDAPKSEKKAVPFDFVREGDAIQRYLIGRLEKWPDEYRSTFEAFVSNIANVIQGLVSPEHQQELARIDEMLKPAG